MKAAGGDAWGAVQQALQSRASEVRRATYLCVEAKSKQQFTQELQGLDASVKALELQVSELRAWVKAESASLPKVEALLKACQLQAGDLHLLAAHLPTHLPSALPPPQQPTRAAGPASDTGGAADQDAGRARPSAVGAGKAGAAAGTRRQGGGGGAAAAHGGPPPPAPRCFITEQELAGVAAYMKGRLTTDKVNAALEELAQLADANARLLAAARMPASALAAAGGAKLTGAERHRATELLHCVAGKDGVKGKSWWLLESDLRDTGAGGGSAAASSSAGGGGGGAHHPSMPHHHLKLDKTGRSILTVLRHLGRLQEVRCTVDGAPDVAYVLQAPS